MVIRRVAGGLPVARSGSRSWRRTSLAAFALGLSVAALPAQDAGTPPQEPAAGVTYGKIVVDEARLRCWSGAVATPPLFEDALVKDQVVQLGRTENGFRAVLLPLGPLGYVSKRFAALADDGSVTSKGSKVAFRYRPRTTEAPVAQLAEGTPLHVIGEDADWYRCRVPGIEAWVAAAEVQVVDGQDATVLAAWEQLAQRQRGEMQERLDAIAAQKKLDEQNRIDLAAVKVVEDAFAAELQKPVGEQKFDPLSQALDKLAATLTPESGARVAVAALQKRIETQRWIAEATAVTKEKPPIDEAAKPVPPPTDRLERFESIGWLRYERHLTGGGTYYLEKGGRRQYVLSCNTGRFDLALFVGREVGVIGPRRQPPGDAMGTLDVERIEVLGAMTN